MVRISYLGLLLGFLLISSVVFAQSAYEKNKARAEKFYQEKSYALAKEAYASLKAEEIPAEEKRWVQFRLADTTWRAAAGSEDSDDTQMQEGREGLEEIYTAAKTPEAKDNLWAQAAKSLGDFHWINPEEGQDWGQAWPYYQAALDWWASAKEIEVARKHYIEIVEAISMGPIGLEADHDYASCGYVIPLEILENYKRIAKDPEQKAHASYLLALTLYHHYRAAPEYISQINEEFEKALALSKKTDWYDDVLYHYAEFLSANGKVITDKNGAVRVEPDYPGALKIYRRLIQEFTQSQTRHWEEAKMKIDHMTQMDLSLSVSHTFLPDSEVQYQLNWRNVDRIQFSLYQVSLRQNMEWQKNDSNGDWQERISLTGAQKIRSWSMEVEDKGTYKPGYKLTSLQTKLPVGAYMLVAEAGGKKAKALVLVTDMTLVVKNSGNKALVYACDALTGAPVAEADTKLWYSFYRNNSTQWAYLEGKSNAQGLVVLKFPETVGSSSSQLFVIARAGQRQAFCTAYANGYSGQSSSKTWKVYAVTDRPAYRPKEKAHWKATMRTYDGKTYTTPTGEVIKYTIHDSKGAELKKGQLTLNSFGSCWDEVELSESTPLGECAIEFRKSDAADTYIGSATLFRLEEYKLPEFKVTVQTPETDGKKKVFRFGDKVEVSAQAEYYFGGAVSNAKVEILVYQNPFYHFYQRQREFSWFYEDIDRSYNNYGNGSIVKREVLTTDASGKAKLTFDTPRHQGHDLEYRIEARVTDSSRREIIGSGTVRVTRQGYYVAAEPQGRIYQPGTKATVKFQAKDANDQPLAVAGTVKITRQFWNEIWISPDGKEVTGAQLQALKRAHPSFPLVSENGNQIWRVKYQGYGTEDIATETVKTTAEGEAELSFTLPKEGYYVFAWSSPDRVGAPVTASTTVWASTRHTTDIGYYTGGLEIIVDKDTFRVGQKAPIMLAASGSSRYVLFGIEPDDLSTYQLIHLDGTTKLLEIDVEEKHVPNFFVHAAMVYNYNCYQQTQQIVVPPTKNFLTVDIEPNQKEYLPRDKGSFTLSTKDAEGRPVSAEVSLGIVDESVFYIQNDYAIDPRQFFFGTKRSSYSSIQNSFQRPYVKLVPWQGTCMDQRYLLNNRLGEDRDSRRQSVFRGEGYATSELEEQLDRAETLASSACDPRSFGLGGATRNREIDRDITLPESAPTPSVTAQPIGSSLTKLHFKNDKKSAISKDKFDQEEQEPQGEVYVRSDFRSTILWKPDIKTDASGKAAVEITYPDSTTAWKSSAKAVSQEQQFGQGETSTQTRQPIIARLQGPRFFVVGDEVVISGVINNNRHETVSIEPKLEASGLKIVGFMNKGKRSSGAPPALSIPAQASARVDWIVAVQEPGQAKLKLTAHGRKGSDAMEMSYPVYEHGIEKFIANSAKLKEANEMTLLLDLPKQRKEGSASLKVQVTPSLAVTMLDALPYLIDYPYGCTEQTMSRFLPAVIVAKTLEDLKIPKKIVAQRLFGGIEQEYANQTHPDAQKKNLQKLDAIIERGLSRLYDFQHSDGGWGWWKEGESDPFMTAYVVWGMSLAEDAGVSLRGGVLSRGVDYLEDHLVESENDLAQQAWMLHALAAYQRTKKITSAAQSVEKAIENLWKHRERLNAYTRSLFAVSLQAYGQDDKAKIVVQNLLNGIRVDKTPDRSVLIDGKSKDPSQTQASATAHWGEDGVHYHWSEGGVEATAFALQAMLAVEPQSPWIEPVTNWLIKNRRGSQWSNTRDTAMVILALNDYLRKSGELETELSYDLLVNGNKITTQKISTQDIFKAPSIFKIDAKFLQDGANKIQLVKKGRGTLYAAAYAQYFSLEKPIPAAGNEIFAKRQYFKKVGRPTLLKGYVYDTVPLNSGDSVVSGERIEVVLTLEAKNNYEYLVFEDLKPAGFEAVEIRSGESLNARELKPSALVKPPAAGVARLTVGGVNRGLVAPNTGILGIPRPAPQPSDDKYTGRTRWVHQELRDRKVALFIDKLAEGVWEVRYELQAQVPGSFAALPLLGHAMYVPEIRCNGDETAVQILDTPAQP